MKRHLALILLAGVLLLPPASLPAGEMRGHGMMKAAVPAADYPPMPGPGKKVPIGEGAYLIFGFDKPLKMGTVIMSVEVFTADGKKDTSVEVKVDADMPSMRGAHGTGDRPLQVSKRGDYVLPVHIMMPGDWELKLTVLKAGKVMFRGRFNFNV